MQGRGTSYPREQGFGNLWMQFGQMVRQTPGGKCTENQQRMGDGEAMRGMCGHCLSRTQLFLSLFSFCFRGREKERASIPIQQPTHNSQYWAAATAGSQKPTPGLPHEQLDHSNVITASQTHQQDAGVDSQSWALNPGSDTRNTGVFTVS